jgi:2-keto-4-pentenoate hydratase/2-oxohepta-3-ene-1,7-dioic acid hydratase in catechol pathway
MPNFTLATLKTSNGPGAAIGLDERYYLLADAQPLLGSVTVPQILRQWDAAFPMLLALAGALAAGKAPDGRQINGRDADLLTPIMYPDKVMAVGANYSGHLREMGLEARKWDSMPFFLRRQPPLSSGQAPR